MAQVKDGCVKPARGPILSAPAGVNLRGRFIIDPDFVIRAMQVLTAEVGRNPDELLR